MNDQPHPRDEHTPQGHPTTIRKSVLVSALLIPLMIVGGFAMLAVIPVIIIVHLTLRDPRLRALRPWAALLGVAYAVPLALWGALPDRAPSLTKDMHPAFAVGIVLAALAYSAAHLLHRRRADRQ
ncbi:hypothetical protein [Streptomyces sp. NPDC047043]|uniref:hypothetical protein n=1 Tax=Streptomyces sp. NPDC047043 TaxID=3154497 RepID=UPI00340ED9FB